MKHLSLLLAAAWLLSACGEFRGMPSLDVKLPETFSESASQTEVSYPAPLKQDWWRQTDDTMLIDLLGRVQQQNLSIEQARERLLAARESSRSLDYLPGITLTADAQYSRLREGDVAVNNVGFSGGSSQKKTTGYYNARMDSSWELPLWGQFSAADDVDRAAFRYAEADLAAVRANVVAEAIRLYAQMRGFQQQKIAQEAIVAAQENIASYQQIKHKAGLITQGELLSAKRSVLEANISMQNMVKDEIASRQQLAALLGQASPDEAWKTPAAIPVIRVTEFSDGPVDVLRNRPDIRRAEAAVLREAGQLELAKADRYPRITLGGSLSQLDNLTGAPLPGKTVQFTGTPSVSIPLFDWGKRLAAAREQDARLSESASAYREAVIAAMTEVETFLAAYHTAKQSEVQTNETAALEQQNQQQAALLFERGLTDGIAAQNAAIAALQADIAALQASVEHLSRLAALTKALGGGIPVSTTPTTEQTP